MFKDIGREEKAIRFKNLFEDIVKAQSAVKSQAGKNFKMYSGLNYGQWDDSAVTALMEQKRPINTFNFVQKYVDTLHGIIIENPYEVKFDPIIGSQMIDETNLLNDLFEYDYERGDWDYEKSKIILNGLIHTGVGELYIDFKHDITGNISLRSLNPFHFHWDNHWQSDDERECQIFFKTTWMTAEQIKDTWNTKSSMIDEAIERMRSFGDTNSDEIDKIADRSVEYFDLMSSRYKVIEACYMERVTKKRIYDKRDKQFVNIEDPFLQGMAMRLQGEHLVVIPESYDICKVFTFCPAVSVNMVLEDGDHPVQIGRPPFFLFSEKNMFGERQGLVDKLSDAQVTLNKRESIMTFWQITQPNGAEFVEEDLFVDDSEFERYIREKNKPGSTFKVSSGAISQGKQAPVKRGEYPADLLQSINRAEQYMEKVTSSNAALQARSEGANESSVLFEAKKAQAMMPFQVIMRNFKRIENGIAEGYFYLCKQVYSDVPKVYQNKNGKIIQINQVDKYGRPYNSIKDLPRHNIIISESRSGTNRKKEELQKYFELSRVTQNPILRSYYEIETYKNLDIPKKVLDDMISKSMVFIDVQHMQALAQIAQLSQQLQQMGAPQQQPGMEVEQPQSFTREAAMLPGMGNLPNNIAGGDNVGNNRAAPSDMRG